MSSRQSTIGQWEAADLDREITVCRMLIEEIERDARAEIIEMIEEADQQ